MQPPPPSIIATTSSNAAPSAAPSSPAAVNPLSVRVTMLRKPELFSTMRSEPELSEDGDILHDVLTSGAAGASFFPQPCSVNPCLTFSNSRAAHLVGENFRAWLSFRNNTTGALTRLFFRVELVGPQNQRTVLFDREVARLEPKCNREIRVEHRLQDAGKYSLSAAVSFCDPLNESRRFTWSSGFDVLRGIVETSRQVFLLPPHPKRFTELQQCSGGVEGRDNTSRKAGDVAAQLLPRICVAVTLQNTLPDAALMLSSVRIIPKENQYVQVAASSVPLKGNITPPTMFSHQYSGGGRDALEDVQMSPGDARQFVFELQSTAALAASSSTFSNASLASSGSGTVAASSNLTFFSSGSTGISAASSASGKSTEIGHIEYEWRRSSGENGVDMTPILRLSRGVTGKSSDIDLVCIGVVPSTTLMTRSSDDDTSGTASTAIRAGRCCLLRLLVVNRSPTSRDVSLYVHPTKLLPYVAYTGPTVKPLGFVDSNTDLEVLLPIVPMCSGLWSIAGLVEVRDARNLSNVLWPLKSPASQAAMPPPLMQSSAGSSVAGSATTTTTAMSLPNEQWPSKLCEVVVM